MTSRKLTLFSRRILVVFLDILISILSPVCIRRVPLPSKLLMAIVPPVKTIYCGIEKNRLKRFVKKKADLEKK